METTYPPFELRLSVILARCLTNPQDGVFGIITAKCLEPEGCRKVR